MFQTFCWCIRKEVVKTSSSEIRTFPYISYVMLDITQQPAYLCVESMIPTPLRLMQTLQPLCALNKREFVFLQHASLTVMTTKHKNIPEFIVSTLHLAIFYQQVQDSPIVEPKILALFSAVAAIEKERCLVNLNEGHV